MYKRSIVTDIPGPKSKTLFREQAVSAFLAGKPDNETHANLVFEQGSGSFIIDLDSNCFVDCANTLNLPFGHEPWHIPENPVVNSSNYMTGQRLQLLSELTAVLPKFAGFQFRSSGTESVEAALRYLKACYPQGLRLFSFEGCYHGLTLAAQQIMGKSYADNHITLPFPVSGEAGSLKEAIETALQSGPAALAFETVQGNSVRALSPQCFRILQELKQQYGERFLLFCDDMLISIRRGNWSSLPEGFQCDLLVGGKSWSGGFPFSFFAISSQVREMAGDILGTTTYGGNPLACQAAQGTIKRIRSEQIFEHIIGCEDMIREKGVPFWRSLEKVARADCEGLLFGIELQDVDTAVQAGLALLKEGVLCARIGRVLRFSPALNISKDLLDEVMTVVSSVLNRL